MSKDRWILHVDMDAFFAAIEQRDHPEYRGKPVMVGAFPNQRGIIATCSYEARALGIHSAMPSRTAGRLCPHGIFLPPDLEKYHRESQYIMAILYSFTPWVEPLSIDEAFLDVTSVQGLFGHAVDVAKKIKDRLQGERRLTASVGVASNKFLAKLASDLQKPDGLTVISEENKHATLASLPVGKLWGIGEVTRKLLERNGFKTIGDIQKTNRWYLKSFLGNRAEHLQQLAWGKDERPIETKVDTKSTGREHTFDMDTLDIALLQKTLFTQAEEVAHELRKTMVAAKTITLKLRYSDFTTLTRQTTLDPPTQDEVAIHEKVSRLLKSQHVKGRKIRLIGISVSNFVAPHIQLDFLDPTLEKRQKLALAIDAIRVRHGYQAIQRVEVVSKL